MLSPLLRLVHLDSRRFCDWIPNGLTILGVPFSVRNLESSSVSSLMRKCLTVLNGRTCSFIDCLKAFDGRSYLNDLKLMALSRL